MRHHLSVLLVTGLLLLGVVGCATDSMTSSSEHPPTSQIAQAPGQTPQPPSGAVQEPGNVPPPPGTDVPAPPTTAGEQGQAAQGEPSSGEIQERAVPRIAPGMAPVPSGMAPLPPCGVGPTENLTKVGCAFQMRAKSLTLLVVVNPGLTLTQPVTISIGFAGEGATRMTQTYIASTGNHFFYNDSAGDGKPRRVSVSITLSEPKAGGGVYNYALTPSVVLDPLYDVSISPLTFTLFTDCDTVGDSEIKFEWFAPDYVRHDASFDTSAGKHTTIAAFAWSRAEVSASANLIMPDMDFYDRDPCGYPPLGGCPTVHGGRYNYGGHYGLVLPPQPLVPGVTRQVVTRLSDQTGQSCTASTQYNITYTLRFYPFL